MYELSASPIILAALQNFRANLLRSNSMAVVGTLLAEEHRHPELLAASGELQHSADPDVLASMLVGSFYARHIATSDIPNGWAERTPATSVARHPAEQSRASRTALGKGRRVHGILRQPP
jgi:hypothetical protein